MKKFGILGFDFESPNKGCEALTYSFINMLIDCFGSDLKIINYSYGGLGTFPQKYPKIDFEIRRPQIKNPLDWKKMKKEMSNLDMIFDVTFGDGFSDIYGKMWNVTTDILKELAIQSGKPLILLPQTYGPYKSSFLRMWAEHIVNKSYAAYSRDTASATEMNSKCGGKVKVLTDMAFALPYDRGLYQIDDTKTNIGINVSALLWDSDYARDNKFNLKINYRSYIRSLIQKLLEDDTYVIHLIPHVIAKEDYNAAENDVRPCSELKKEFLNNERVVCAPAFENPIGAKSYIANMDVFMGARMHSTIGALSAGVATIPFAYSKKFKTMFGNLHYDYTIEARELDTEAALEQTQTYIREYKTLAEAAKEASKITKEKLGVLKKDMAHLGKTDM
ncbi:polysaccharide pyruvyl transferase family protein [uncultured Phocaeicola sp.]|uniref:polysaccharide pyruvyl transferase family protein n=1 Tax=uncultured Phocaeicola sp. TaxID=990718 RepID=UPI00259A26FC|nr:polysaccharide pyruvyl transferase family protein [uncultured Phocaeicola sp.]